ncbi:MAG: phosphoribosyltransferase [Candidatus Kerfeldbacteria bacterium]|nr:phosphoribosyltransferase [Candidatus Kerfeldbacteria bacterium]
MNELQVVDGIDPRSLIEPNEVYVSWSEVGLLAQEVVLQLVPRIEKLGPFDTIVAIKHGATHFVSLVERVLDHNKVAYARLRREETGLSERDSPSPKIVYFPSDEDLRDKNVGLFDEVWETGKSNVRAQHRIMDASPRSLTTITLHFKSECNIFPERKPDIFAAEIDPRYRLYPWELWERVMQARVRKMQAVAVVA